ncbi:phosphotransferase family enzyme [Saccharothrix saharensis]|uniref:Phosphotransferase family enzyme n=1 Tax=Saccharothrix saharensis TaxID=571190 RepID=A0A543JF07_9PSEU|nr:aminoglycoside phosphotransferase family protein [Saccharothrix saharensis]TQM81341.1 phosphotransferase family enzyme [Saccharothrix saharensis]
MQASEFRRAVAAATSIAASVGLVVRVTVVLQDSNKLTLRLLPCDVLARVAPEADQVAGAEIALARRLAESGGPVAAPAPGVEPRAHERDGFVVTLWTYYESVTPEVPPADYADALVRLHAGLRRVDVPAPHFTDRVEQARRVVASRELSPDLADADRDLLGGALRDLRRAVVRRAGTEQLLHGEPHPGNLLGTAGGPLFVDWETHCRGPVEFDLAHAPEDVADHYPGVDRALVDDCRVLVPAMVTAWRWDRDDRFPDGRRLGVEGLGRLREALRSRATP